MLVRRAQPGSCVVSRNGLQKYQYLSRFCQNQRFPHTVLWNVMEIVTADDNSAGHLS